LGLVQFQAGEYANALRLWKRALVAVPHDYEQQATRAMIVGNIIAAHRLAYQAGHKPEHLVEANGVIDLRKLELTQFKVGVVAGGALELDRQRAELGRLYQLARHNGEVASELPPGTAFHIPPKPELTDTLVDKELDEDPQLGARY